MLRRPLLSVIVCNLIVVASAIHIPHYARDPRIHNLGNTGMSGRVHAHMAPVATALIDQIAYGGVDVRRALHQTLPTGRVVDLGCGTGRSTPAGAIGVDTSGEMLDVARTLSPGKVFNRANAETYGSDDEFDVSLLFFVLHEAPGDARLRLMNNALRIARQVIIADIAPAYNPSQMMLTGEPYVLSYLKNIEWEVAGLASVNGCSVKTSHMAAGRVVIFELSRGSLNSTQESEKFK